MLKYLLVLAMLPTGAPVIAQTYIAESLDVAGQEILLAQKKSKSKRKKGTKYKKDKEFEWSHNQKTPPKSLETNVFGVLNGVVNLEYYLPWGGPQSALGAAAYLYGIGSDVSGFGVGGLYSYYLNKLFDGIYVTGGATFTSISINDTSASGISALGIGGYKYNMSESFSISGGLGVQYFTFSGSLDGFSAIGLSLIINLGMYLN